MLQCDLLDKSLQPRSGIKPSLFIHESNQELANYLAPTEPAGVRILIRTHHSQRMRAQQGLFILSNKITVDYDALIQEIVKSRPDGVPNNNSVLSKYIIPAHLKRDILLRLQSMNITALALFPGLDGLGRSIREDVILANATAEMYLQQYEAARRAGTNQVVVSADGWAPAAAPASQAADAPPG